jgi:hypothetical protein
MELQKEPFPFLAKYGNIWHEEELQSQLIIFPKDNLLVEDLVGTIVYSASTLLYHLTVV